MVLNADRNIPKMMLVGRVLIALIFIVSGLSKIPGWDSTVQYLASKGLPWVPVFLFPAIFIEVVGGLSVLLGYKARIGALVLSLYLIPVSLVMHSFWNFTGMEFQTQLANFMKNLAIMGGLLQIVTFGAGRISLDYLVYRKNTQAPSQPRDRIRAVS